MASIKNLKKDIHFLTNELAAECLFKMLLHPETSEEAVNQIAAQGITLRSELIKRIAHRDAKNNAKLAKEYFNLLNKDMIEGYSKLFDQLAGLK
jgi:formamidopyrimidine-DNA glycosylase